MKEIKTSDINNININNDIRLLLKNKNDVSLKAWSFLYDILQKYNINLLKEQIVFNEFGKPYLKTKKIYFNISHSKNLIAIIISDKECAIDIQYVDNKKEHDKYINKILSDNEKVIYNTHLDKISYFYELWTKKETYYKYLGTGINISDLSKIKNYEGIETKEIHHLNDKYFLSFK